MWKGFCDEWITKPIQSFGICLAFSYTVFVIIYSIIKNIYKYYISKMEQQKKEEVKYPDVPTIKIEQGEPKFDIKPLPELEMPELIKFSKPMHIKQYSITKQKYIDEYNKKKREIKKIKKANKKRKAIHEKICKAIEDDKSYKKGKYKIIINKKEYDREIKRELRDMDFVIRRPKEGEVDFVKKIGCGIKACFAKKKMDENLRILKFTIDTARDIYEGTKDIFQ